MLAIPPKAGRAGRAKHAKVPLQIVEESVRQSADGSSAHFIAHVKNRARHSLSLQTLQLEVVDIWDIPTVEATSTELSPEPPGPTISVESRVGSQVEQRLDFGIGPGEIRELTVTLHSRNAQSEFESS